jgi:hypothetical protein
MWITARHHAASRMAVIDDRLPRPPPGAALVQRAALAAGHPRLRRAWAFAYEAAARAFGGWLLTGRRDATLYARGSVASRRVVPGMSDLDLVVVVADDAGARAVAGRHAALERRAPWLGRAVLERPRTYRAADLERVAGASALTFDGAVYAPDVPQGVRRHLERGGEDVGGWRRLRGPERRPRRQAPDPQARRLAAWLEVQYRWRWAWRAIGGEAPPVRERDLAAKLVTETARAWEGVAGGAPELDAATAAALAEAQAIETAPGRGDGGVLARLVPAAIDLASGLAREIAEQIDGGAATAVALVGADHELVLPWGSWAPPPELRDAARAPLPLADWRAVARPGWPDEALVPLDADARDVTLLRAAQRSSTSGPYPALRAGGLLLFVPGRFLRSALRTVQAPFSDPVSCALLDGRGEARFPGVAGWSADDQAARAIQEHRAALRYAGDDREGLGNLIGSARAALFAQSLATREPTLLLTARATLAALADHAPAAHAAIEEAGRAYRDETVTPAVVASFRRVVAGLEAYR